MAETQVKKEVCNACGSDVRPESLFCYHCGGQLDVEDVAVDEPSDVWFRGEIAPADRKKAKEQRTDSSENKAEPEELLGQADSDELQKDESEPTESKEKREKDSETKVNIKPKPFKERSKKKGYKKRPKKSKSKDTEDTKLKSAAALRRREKPSRLKKVEIVWEERDASPNIWFIVFALFLSLLVAGMVFLALYLK